MCEGMHPGGYEGLYPRGGCVMGCIQGDMRGFTQGEGCVRSGIQGGMRGCIQGEGCVRGKKQKKKEAKKNSPEAYAGVFSSLHVCIHVDLKKTPARGK